MASLTGATELPSPVISVVMPWKIFEGRSRIDEHRELGLAEHVDEAGRDDAPGRIDALLGAAPGRAGRWPRCARAGCPMSAAYQGAPVPSMIRPCSMITSYIGALAAGAPERAGSSSARRDRAPRRQRERREPGPLPLDLHDSIWKSSSAWWSVLQACSDRIIIVINYFNQIIYDYFIQSISEVPGHSARRRASAQRHRHPLTDSAQQFIGNRVRPHGDFLHRQSAAPQEHRIAEPRRRFRSVTSMPIMSIDTAAGERRALRR